MLPIGIAVEGEAKAANPSTVEMAAMITSLLIFCFPFVRIPSFLILTQNEPGRDGDQFESLRSSRYRVAA